MSSLGTSTLVRRADLVLRPVGDDGRHVVKDLASGAMFQLGEQEAFLLDQFDGRQGADQIRGKFQERFGEPLDADELAAFASMARQRGLLGDSSDPPTAGNPLSQGPAQSLLYWRRRIFDPDRLFNWLAPRLWFFWTPAFLIGSALSILAAVLVLWANRLEFVTYFAGVMRWETAIAAWLTLIAVTTCHEFAHGLTCKRYGGEVHEVGFLLLFLLPGFYCNVSDAWLLREKSKRLWVTFAGGYFELFLWSLAVFVWYLTVQDSLVNYLALLVTSMAGVRVLFNFNPLLKLDGYYLLSDWLDLPNLRNRSIQYAVSHARWLLWGAARPERERRGKLLLGLGIASWIFSLVFLGVLVTVMARFAGARWGMLAAVGTVTLGAVAMRGLFTGFSQGEVVRMFRLRRARAAMWIFAPACLLAGLWVVPVQDRAGGRVELRPVTRTELRAPVAGFLTTVYFHESDEVAAGDVVAVLEVPDLSSRTASKRAEVAEANAKLRLLEAGSRSEEIAIERQRVERAGARRDLARRELGQRRAALAEDLAKLDALIAQHEAELGFAQASLARLQTLVEKNAISEEAYQEAKAKARVSEALRRQAVADRRSREALGTLEAEVELAEREDRLAEARASLELLEAGSRLEDIDAQREQLAKLQAELAYLEFVQDKLLIRAVTPGVVVTSRLNEQVGRYLEEGDLICEIEDPRVLEAEIKLTEAGIAPVRVGQPVWLKTRALPFRSFEGRVDRIAPKATPGDVQSTVTVYCRISNEDALLRPQMQGYARVHCGRRPLGEILAERSMGFLRTQFWW